MCTSGDIEDELHVLLKCSAYRERRSAIPYQMNEDNIWRLLSSDDVNTIKALCDYIYDITEIRSTLFEIFV